MLASQRDEIQKADLCYLDRNRMLRTARYEREKNEETDGANAVEGYQDQYTSHVLSVWISIGEREREMTKVYGAVTTAEARG